MDIKLSCTANMVPGENLTEKAHILRKLGYDGMAIFVDAPDWKDELLDEMLQMEEKTGVKPCEFVLTAGYYGNLMNTDPEIRKQILGDEQPLTGRYADTLEPAFEKTKQQLGDLARSDEDVLSYIAFPQLAEAYFEKRKAAEENIVTYTFEEA